MMTEFREDCAIAAGQFLAYIVGMKMKDMEGDSRMISWVFRWLIIAGGV
jgi:hypothetical protein